MAGGVPTSLDVVLSRDDENSWEPGSTLRSGAGNAERWSIQSQTVGRCGATHKGVACPT